MLHKVVSIYDVKAQAFMKPIFVQSHGAAVRSFGDAVNDAQTEFHKHPEDYSMFSMGEFDDDTGTFTIEKSPVELAKAIALVSSS